MLQAHVPAQDLDRLASVVGLDRVRRLLEEDLPAARKLLDGVRVVNVNSTAAGGGVAEMLQVLLGYTTALGIDSPWLVVEGTPAFFQVTKRIHNHLYGFPGDGGPLGETERDLYRAVLDTQAPALLEQIRPGDQVQQLMTHTKSRLFGVSFKGRIINAGFILDSNPLIYYHLSANDTSLYHLHANHFFLDQVTRLYAGKRSRFFLGGGSTEEKEDPLLRFKKKFSKHRAPFYIGGLITDENAYTQLNQQWQDLHPQDTRKYFLKYRLTG